MQKEDRIYKVFIVSISLTIAVFLIGVFLGIALHNRNIFIGQVLIQARAQFRGIVTTRQWNSNYGGVYVEKKEGVETNPYLDDPEITSTDGRVFTLRNPALMTREISELSNKSGGMEFRITSLKPLNPNNSPDEFETEALKSIQLGDSEYFREVRRDGKDYFRYMAPLYVEASCLVCHAKQGYRLGDVRGGISVTMDIDELKKRSQSTTAVILGLGLAFLLLTLLIIYHITMRLINRLERARSVINEMAITDGLTNVYNRRYIMTRFAEEFQRAQRAGEPLGCIMIDLDHFKRVNDTFGHQTGDRVLTGVAGIIATSIRLYDIVGRYGGEEFILLLPNTDHDESKAMAERVRLAVKEGLRVKADTGDYVRVTVSLGVTSMLASDEQLDQILKRADVALYNSKRAGRDRTMTA